MLKWTQMNANDDVKSRSSSINFAIIEWTCFKLIEVYLSLIDLICNHLIFLQKLDITWKM